MWDFIFSENFFYFVPLLEEVSMDIGPCPGDVMDKSEIVCSSDNCLDHQQRDSADIFHMEVISFVEFAATLNGNKHNMVCSSVFLLSCEISLNLECI